MTGREPMSAQHFLSSRFPCFTHTEQQCHNTVNTIQEQQCTQVPQEQYTPVEQCHVVQKCFAEEHCTATHVRTTINVLGHLAARPLRGAIAGSRFVKREADADYTVPHLVSAANVEAAPVAAVRTAVAHLTVAYQGYEQPKQNCSVLDVVEVADVGTPALDTVCQPDAGYGYHEYSHNYYKEDAQGTCYNVPGLNFVESAVEVTYPKPIQTGGNEPISLPRISCEDLSEEK